MAIKVVIENAVLRGSRQEQFLQRVATAYVDQTEYRVSAPAKATGSALEWVQHFVVRQQSGDGTGESPVEDRALRFHRPASGRGTEEERN